MPSIYLAKLLCVQLQMVLMETNYLTKCSPNFTSKFKSWATFSIKVERRVPHNHLHNMCRSYMANLLWVPTLERHLRCLTGHYFCHLCPSWMSLIHVIQNNRQESSANLKHLIMSQKCALKMKHKESLCSLCEIKPVSQWGDLCRKARRCALFQPRTRSRP